MTNNQFEKFRELIYANFGIKLAPQKKQMIQARLNKVLKRLGISTYKELYDMLLKDKNPDHWAYFIHEITTHKTEFFREKSHFQFLEQGLDFILGENSRIEMNKEIRVWSAGCSTGEEAYTIAMVLKEHLPPQIKIKILATDISQTVVAKAQQGVYSHNSGAIDNYYLTKYFEVSSNQIKVKHPLKSLLTFRTFNLMKEFPFENGFDLIFCRNVMIYFGNDIQEQLVKKFFHTLVPGGLFFIGHSESLANKKHNFQYIKPTIYIKNK